LSAELGPLSSEVRLLFTGVARVQVFGRNGTDVRCHKSNHAVFVLHKTAVAVHFA
jgi:hypothetical protein